MRVRGAVEDREDVLSTKGQRVTRARVVFVLSTAMALLTTAPSAIAHIGAQTGPQSLGGEDWLKVLRDFGANGLVAIIFGWSLWKITPRVLSLLDKMHGSIDALQEFVERVNKRMDEDEARRENDDATLLRQALEQINRLKKESGT